jgi:hypothetical protein
MQQGSALYFHMGNYCSQWLALTYYHFLRSILEIELMVLTYSLTYSLTYLPTYLGVIEPAGELIIGSIIGYFIYLILYLIDLNGNQLQGTHLLTHSITTLRIPLLSLLLT